MSRGVLPRNYLADEVVSDLMCREMSRGVLTRRNDREYREYLREEQRSQQPGPPPRVFQRGGVERGCIAGRMQLEFHRGLLRATSNRQGKGEPGMWSRHSSRCDASYALGRTARQSI